MPQIDSQLRSAALGLGYTIECDGERFGFRNIEKGEPLENAGRRRFTVDELGKVLHAEWRAQNDRL